MSLPRAGPNTRAWACAKNLAEMRIPWPRAGHPREGPGAGTRPGRNLVQHRPPRWPAPRQCLSRSWNLQSLNVSSVVVERQCGVCRELVGVLERPHWARPRAQPHVRGAGVGIWLATVRPSGTPMETSSTVPRGARRPRPAGASAAQGRSCSS